MSMATLMAPKKKPGRPKASIRRETVLGLKGTAEWKTWLEEFADHCRLSMADTIDQSLTEHAERKGFRPPPYALTVSRPGGPAGEGEGRAGPHP